MILDVGAYLQIKLITVPLFILIVSLLVRKCGPTIGGLIVGLPLTSAPVIVFLALEQGNSFASGASQGIMMGLISVTIFCLVYSWFASSQSWSVCMVTSSISYFAVTALLSFLTGPLIVSFVAVEIIIIVISRLFPSGARSAPRKSFRWEIPARMAAATGLVVLITESAPMLGPHLSGLLTPFPIYATVLGVFIHRFDGPKPSALFLRGVVTGCFTSAFFFFLFASFIAQWNLLGSVSLALLGSLITHSILLYVVSRK